VLGWGWLEIQSVYPPAFFIARFANFHEVIFFRWSKDSSLVGRTLSCNLFLNKLAPSVRDYLISHSFCHVERAQIRAFGKYRVLTKRKYMHAVENYQMCSEETYCRSKRDLLQEQKRPAKGRIDPQR